LTILEFAVREGARGEDAARRVLNFFIGHTSAALI
jgi:hypothetical protein